MERYSYVTVQLMTCLDLLFLPASLPHRGPEELVSELKSVWSELVSKVENLDQSVQSIVKAMGADSTGNSRNGSRSESTFQRRQEMSLIF